MKSVSNLFYQIIHFLIQIKNALAFNGLYIILSVLLPLLVMKGDLGRNILEYLIDINPNQGIILIALNASLLVFVFTLLGLAMWLIPTLAIKSVFKRTRPKHMTLFKKIIEKYNRRPNSLGVKYVAILPWWIFTSALILAYCVHNAIWFLLFVTFTFIILRLYDSHNVIARFRKLRYSFASDPVNTRIMKYLLILISAFFIFLAMVFGLVTFFENAVKYVIIVANIVGMIGFYSYMSVAEAAPFAPVNDKSSFKYTNCLYVMVLIAAIAGAVTLAYINHYCIDLINKLSPAYVAITMITFFLVIADLLFSAQYIKMTIFEEIIKGIMEQLPKDKFKNMIKSITQKCFNYKILIVSVGLAFFVSYFFYSNNDHRIREQENMREYYTVGDRPELESYFDNWFDHCSVRMANDTIPVFLISGEGGGSRAATWFLVNINNLEKKYRDTFTSNIFSISTVSGSSSGAGMYLSDRYYGKNVAYKSDYIPLPQIKRIYARNYYSSTLFGILLGDGLEGLLGGKMARDRNYYLQKDETKAYSDVLRDQHFNVPDSVLLLEKDYLNPYIGKEAALNKDTRYPLFFCNTTAIGYSARAVFSPIQMKDFSLGEDAYAFFKGAGYQCTCKGYNKNKRNLCITTAICQSQAVPWLNSFNYLDGLGQLADGGMFDNSGCTTTMELYQALHRLRARNSKYSKVKFYLVNIMSSNLDKTPPIKFNRASVLNTLNGTFGILLKGHEKYSYRYLNGMAKYWQDPVINIMLTELAVPTSRILTDEVIDSLNCRSINILNQKAITALNN